MKKAKKRLSRLWDVLKGISLSFLVAAFIYGFVMAHEAHTLANLQKAYASGYALCVYREHPLSQRNMLPLPNGAIEATSLEDPTARHRDQFAQGLHLYAD